jgi:hypothetical protein
MARKPRSSTTRRGAGAGALFTKRNAVIAAAAAIVAAPLAYFAYVEWIRSSDGVQAIVVDAGFYPITPPNTLVEPGSVYQVSADGRIYVRICKADEADVRRALVSSPAEERIARRLQGGSFALDTQVAGEVNSRLNANLVSAVEYTLRDVALLEIPLEQNEEIFIKMTGRKACNDAIHKLLTWGYLVCQGQAVLRATTQYTLLVSGEGDANLDLSDEAVKSALSAVVSTDVAFANGSFTTGDGLHYGVRVNPICVTLPGDSKPKTLPPPRLASRF